MNGGSFEDPPLRVSAGADLAAAWRSLPARGALEVTCSPAEAPGLALAAERAGFFGIRLESPGIRAWKGKSGPCHETGRSATYRGSALAAMDDDGHLLLGTIRVCEKTAEIYRSPAYAGLVDVTGEDPALLGRLATDPAPFDCDTFERDARELARRLPAEPPAKACRAVLYPGPFRLLVLADGSLLRRGEAASVDASAAELLLGRDGARPAAAAPPAASFAKLFREQGPAVLLEPAGVLAPASRGTPHYPALGEAPLKLRNRLLTLLRRGDDYFLLTGSDPADPSGCCPSDDVGAALVLVRAGILDRSVPAPEAACPSSIFAFRGELRLEAGKPVVTRDEPFRASVREYLESGRGLGRRILVRLILIALLALGAAGLLRQLLRG